jgi:ArsR family transcriptional regulator
MRRTPASKAWRFGSAKSNGYRARPGPCLGCVRDDAGLRLRSEMLQTARVPVDRLFRAFSDRTRLRILHLLHSDELCVGDLVAILRVPQPTASRHLAYLRRAGLVTVRKDASWSYYSLAEPRNSFHAKLLDCLSSCFSDVPELERDRARRARTTRCC